MADGRRVVPGRDGPRGDRRLRGAAGSTEHVRATALTPMGCPDGWPVGHTPDDGESLRGPVCGTKCRGSRAVARQIETPCCVAADGGMEKEPFPRRHSWSGSGTQSRREAERKRRPCRVANTGGERSVRRSWSCVPRVDLACPPARANPAGACTRIVDPPWQTRV